MMVTVLLVGVKIVPVCNHEALMELSRKAFVYTIVVVPKAEFNLSTTSECRRRGMPEANTVQSV